MCTSLFYFVSNQFLLLNRQTNKQTKQKSQSNTKKQNTKTNHPKNKTKENLRASLYVEVRQRFEWKMSNYEKLCDSVGVFDTASRSSIVQRAPSQVLLLARNTHKGFTSCAKCWTTLRECPLWGNGNSHQNTPQTKYQAESVPGDEL